MAAPRERRTFAWSLRLLRWHVVLAHACLLLALGWIALRPACLLASAVHPEVLACVHLVTLGYLTTSCVGAFHVVLPLAMGTSLRATFVDWFLLVALQLTATGVAAHMALQTYSGVSWSAALLLLALVAQFVRLVPALARARAALPTKVGCMLAWGNLVFAVCLGGSIAVHRLHPWLPLDWMQTVGAHAHLALGGFVGTLVAALGARLLPMFLPAAVPPAALSWTAVLGLGVGGLVSGVGAMRADWLPAGQWLLVIGASTWLLGVVAMLLRRRPRARSLPPILPSHLLLLVAVLSVVAALVVGVQMLAGQRGPAAWATYGGFVLLGGFGSLVLGIGHRLLPMASHLQQGTPTPHRMPSSHLAWATAVLWALGVPLLPVALSSASAGLLRTAMLVLAVAVAVDLVNALRQRAEPPRLLCSPHR